MGRPHSKGKMFRGPQFIEQSFNRAQCGKKCFYNRLYLIEAYSFVSFLSWTRSACRVFEIPVSHHLTVVSNVVWIKEQTNKFEEHPTGIILYKIRKLTLTWVLFSGKHIHKRNNWSYGDAGKILVFYSSCQYLFSFLTQNHLTISTTINLARFSCINQMVVVLTFIFDKSGHFILTKFKNWLWTSHVRFGKVTKSNLARFWL